MAGYLAPTHQTPMPYRLPPSDPDARGIVRATREQLAKAIDALARGGDDAEAIHTARKSVKKARSALRLLRPTRPELYERENSAMRDSARHLSPLRDQHVLLQTLDERFADMPGYAAARQHLEALADPAVLGEAAQTHDAVPAALEGLRRTLARLEAPPEDAEDDDALARGWRLTVKRTRKAYKKAKKTCGTEDLHTLRKRMKDVDYQSRLLRDLRGQGPKQRKRVRKLASRITDRLGDHHDLSMLHEALGANINDPERMTAPLLDAIETRRNTLAEKALRKTKRLLKAVKG